MHPETSDLAVTPSADNAKHKPIMVVGRKVPEKVICEICSKLVSKANYGNHLKNHEPPTMECPKCPTVVRIFYEKISIDLAWQDVPDNFIK